MIRVTVWNEYRHEKLEPAIAAVYPQGIHQAIADFLGKEDDITVRTATLDEPECGLTEEGARTEASRCLRCDHYGYGIFRGGRNSKW